MTNLIEDKSLRTTSFTRRAFVLGALQLGVLGVLGGRLAWLQIAQGKKYKTLAEENRINVKLLRPTRGEITDRFGVPLAVNEQDFRALIIPEQAKDIESALAQLAKFITLDKRDAERTLKRAKRSAKFIPVEIKSGLTREDISKIEVNLPYLPGITTETGEQRTYPMKDATAHLVGYVAAPSEKDIEAEKGNAVLTLPGFRIGRSGIEKAYESKLRGKEGQADMEVNVVGREVRTLNRKESLTGARIALTIDAELQRIVQQRVNQERSASAVIMDVHNGAVYAMASSPSFDPNLFVDGISHANWKLINDNPQRPMNNKAITGLYPPASTYKMIVALALLESGIADQHTTTYCKGHMTLGRDKFHCWRKQGHGRMNVLSALEQSCDIYFYELSLKLGIDRIAEMARRFGLGIPTGIELPGEKGGLIPDKKWKKQALDETWQPGETVVASIGQGYTQSTPLQLATMIARLVNGGYAVEPHVTGAIGSKTLLKQDWPSMQINPAHLKTVIKGMERVMNGTRGTARASQIKQEGFEMGGKTGTAQVRRITKAQRAAGIKNEELPWEQRHHALFTGFAPLNNPQYACAVVVEHGIGGSRAAAPLARDIMLEAQRRAPAKTKVAI